MGGGLMVFSRTPLNVLLALKRLFTTATPKKATTARTVVQRWTEKGKTMTDREKLIKLLCEAHSMSVDAELFEDSSYAQQLEIEADFLIANGVTFAEDTNVPSKNDCYYCQNSAGMMVTTRNILKDRSVSGWLGGNWEANFCPKCGRKLPKQSKEVE
jgi:hypothetical protein